MSDVTIGIPLFNEETFIEAAIRSSAGQCQRLVVADNASTDRSAEICRRLAAEFPHMTFIRHDRNLGAADNFRFVLEQARTPYFMWLGAHDRLSPGYVEGLKAALDADSTAVLSFGAVTRIDRDDKEGAHFDYPYREGFAARDARERLKSLVRDLTDCALVHGVFRTEVVKQTFSDGLRYFACDHVLLGRAIVAGRFAYVPGVRLLRRDVRIGDTREHQLERIVGTSPDRVSYRPVARNLYALALDVSANAGAWRAFRYRFAVHYLLTSRWGRFGETSARRLLEHAFRAIHVVTRWVRKGKTP